jgi:hypothetical protein
MRLISLPGKFNCGPKCHVAPPKAKAALLGDHLVKPLPARPIGVVFAADENAALNTAIRHFRMHKADWPLLLARQV